MNNGIPLLMINEQGEPSSLLEDYLTRQGFDLRVVTHSDVTTLKVAQARPALIILEIPTEPEQALERCQMLKSNLETASIPVIALSNNLDVKIRLQAFALGAVDFILRPCSRQELLARLLVHYDLASHGVWSDRHEKLQQLVEDYSPPPETPSAKLDRSIFERLVETLKSRLDNPPSVSELAHESGFSVDKLNELFNQYGGKTVAAYLNDLRLGRASDLLKDTSLTIAFIGRHVGYNHAGDFTPAFRKRFGMTPKSFRQHHTRHYGLHQPMKNWATESSIFLKLDLNNAFAT
jgi:AraC-like DNA-binding protein/ActR/RegA family two-component response regulator